MKKYFPINLFYQKKALILPIVIILSFFNLTEVKAFDCQWDLEKATCKNPGVCFDNKTRNVKRVENDSGTLVDVAVYLCTGKQWTSPLDSEGVLYECSENLDGIKGVKYEDIIKRVDTTGVVGGVVDSLIVSEYSFKDSFDKSKYGCVRAVYTGDPVNVVIKPKKVEPLTPISLIQRVATFLYYFAIFYFIVLMLINAFSYVRSGEDPSKLKQINESLFNTVAGFIFVIASGGVILYILNLFNK